MKKAQGNLELFLLFSYSIRILAVEPTPSPTKTDRPMALAYIRSFPLCRW